MKTPVSVLMAVYNGSAYLKTAVESILGQTYQDFHFLIVDDASTDQTRALIGAYNDPRIELLALPKNIGQTAALNRGLRQARSPWIARIDADDYAHPNRLRRQMETVSRHPELRCLGTGFWEFTEDPLKRERVVTRPRDETGIRQAALHGSGMIHGTILVSREALLACGAYEERYRYASDRDMFFRLIGANPVMNLSEPLVGIRRHPGQDSFTLQAVDEYVEIFQKQLVRTGYTRREQSILRRSLSYTLLFRARFYRASRQYPQWRGDLWSALRHSPGTCARNLGGEWLKQIFAPSVWSKWVLNVGRFS